MFLKRSYRCHKKEPFGPGRSGGSLFSPQSPFFSKVFLMPVNSAFFELQMICDVFCTISLHNEIGDLTFRWGKADSITFFIPIKPTDRIDIPTRGPRWMIPLTLFSA